MQISQVKREELMLLVHALRSVHVSDMEDTRHKLVVQLEIELTTRFGVQVGTDADQERGR